MAGKVQSFGLAVFVCMWVAAGCVPSAIEKDTQTPLSVEQRQAMLAREISRKFENPEAHFELGQLYQKQGRLGDAEFHYRTAISFDAVHWPARAALVKVLEQSNQAATAKQTAEAFMNEVGTSTENLLGLGRAFQEQHVDNYALACYRQALPSAPDSPEAHKRLGDYYWGKGDKVRAEEYYRRSFELDWNQPDVAYQLGLLGRVIRVAPEKSGQPTENQTRQ
jgi:Tfp pilus assembly protein PilF